MLRSVRNFAEIVLLLSTSSGAFAIDISNADWESLKRRIDEVELHHNATPRASDLGQSALDGNLDLAPNASTSRGKLVVSGLVQEWYYAIQHDSQGFFNDPNVNHISDSNAVLETNGFRVKRAEIILKMDLNENFSSYLLIDPAREVLGYPFLPSNQGDFFGTKKANQVSPEYLAANKLNGVNSTTFVSAAQNGYFTRSTARLLVDAYLNAHDLVPHHDFQIGQFTPGCGEEGMRSSGQLDFVERSMIGIYGNGRDMGLSTHGSWWESDDSKGNGRVQYWVGIFDGAGTFFEPGNQQNRPDTNSSKDFNARVLVRPIWDDCWGKFEIGASILAGRHGEGHNENPLTAPTNNDLNRPSDWASHDCAWSCYRFGSCLSGLWLRSEWAWIKDREIPGTVIDVQGHSTGPNPYAQEQGRPFSRQGEYGSIGYDFRSSRIAHLPGWLKPVEINGRFEQFQNIETADLATPYKTDVFYTRVWTSGVNYYIHGHNAKVQANYNVVNLPADKSNANRVFHDTRNNSFVINFQIAF